MLPMQQGPGSASCMCWRPVCHALQHPATPSKFTSHGKAFSSGVWAAMLSRSCAQGYRKWMHFHYYCLKVGNL